MIDLTFYFVTSNLGLECLQPEQYGLKLSNGYFSCPSPITYQSVCSLVCNPGFKLTQKSSAICKVDTNNKPLLRMTSPAECVGKVCYYTSLYSIY